MCTKVMLITFIMDLDLLNKLSESASDWRVYNCLKCMSNAVYDATAATLCSRISSEQPSSILHHMHMCIVLEIPKLRQDRQNNTNESYHWAACRDLSIGT